MSQSVQPTSRPTDAVPPHVFFAVSAIFHYLGPAFAVLLFPAVGVLGVAWFRIASAGLIFLPIARPWRSIATMTGQEKRLILALGVTLAIMNTSFYLALERLPMALVATLEFLGVIALAAIGLRTGRNWLALALAMAGVALLIGLGPAVAGAEAAMADPVGLFWAGLNAVLFMVYVGLGHRLSRTSEAGSIVRLGTAMSVAFVVVCPIGFVPAMQAFANPWLVLAGIGVGLSSSVIPYVCDQLAMARLPRASFALMLALLPAVAMIVGALVLLQIPTPADLAGLALVMAGVALHRPAS